jgi:type IV pilus assembly protein PilX
MMIHSRQKQQGVALVISLIILISLTMLGLTSIQRTTTDLAMAGNQREVALMFQAAEVGLVSGENHAAGLTSNADVDDPAAGLHTVLANDPAYTGPDYFDKSRWENNSQIAKNPQGNDTTLDAAEQPRYIIEYLGDRAQNALASVNIGGYGTQQTGDIVSIYRTTARGTGLTGLSFRYVQSYFGRDAP